MSIVIKAPHTSGTEYTINPPQWGYTVSINMPLSIARAMNGIPVIWDDGATYDIRTLKCDFMLNAAMTELLLDIVKDASKGRDDNVDIILTSGSGFYPFGPDKGDAGTFQCRITDCQPSASIGHPQDLFPVSCEFVFNGSYPVYSIPARVSEGNLTIGSISGIRYPQNMHVQQIKYGVGTNITRNGSAYTLDKTTGDVYETTLDITSNHANMARLTNELAVTVRGSAVNITPPANSYMFGQENGSTATYSCKTVQNEIVITHDNFNSFSISLTFCKVA